MANLSDVFQVIIRMKNDGVIEDYAIGGATAVLFYAEPLRTYDLDVFVLLPAPVDGIVRLTAVYQWLDGLGFRPDAEHIMVHGVPVQILPSYNELVDEAITQARDLDYDEGVRVRVVNPEHLVALAMQAGGGKRREHVARLLEGTIVDRGRLEEILSRHDLLATFRSHWSGA